MFWGESGRSECRVEQMPQMERPRCPVETGREKLVEIGLRVKKTVVKPKGEAR